MCFGFSHLPVAPWAVGLLLLGMFGLPIDVQAGGLGPWTFIGGASLVAGSIWLYGGPPRLDPAWWVLVLVIGATLLFMLSGMTAMVRSRFSTPTIGREELSARWEWRKSTSIPTASCASATRCGGPAPTGRRRSRAGDAVRVVAIEGVVLEVEPEDGRRARLPRPRRPPRTEGASAALLRHENFLLVTVESARYVPPR